MEHVLRNRDSHEQNRKLAMILLSIMALLVVVSVVTILVRN
jgi:hypothetical protein